MTGKRNHSVSFSRTVLCLVVIFLFIPLLVVVLYSFNSNKGTEWESASLVWYEQLFLHSPRLWNAFGHSLVIALTSTE